ncbi:Formylglycine-generating enzyme, required for sulfatase activity, contains SUMF1/FGE domain [Cyclonatronum proteinivorum]|uniref:Formylglycine-generating enzyme, required for sulfatase activity, contains SUMF1/FGE domain n=1 Tax=Cyclonatronum proteinivorum TaxID=1457365 RepID=A0A345UP50_9BACT|nr:SUMF1/EgtB/PvdO family nonheme iron enzyme [Cyclonatronum proteinivorum]AXJ02252.1 Formylglycine-generating enzyme, required for sulfatase activity, contains SUMF1/FGE domain [Cyclonatronum proteinivorum]
MKLVTVLFFVVFIAATSSNESFAQSEPDLRDQQESVQSRFSLLRNVDLNLEVGTSSFIGNYRNFANVFNPLPLPINGYSLRLTLQRPVYNFWGITAQARFGLSVLSYSSDLQRSAIRWDYDIAELGLIPGNIKNTAIGPEIGLSLRIPVYGTIAVSPEASFAYQYHNPRTDYLLNESGQAIVPGSGFRNEWTQDFPLRRTEGGKAIDEVIPEMIPSYSLGGSLEAMILGTEFFATYRYNIFLNNYFDGIDQLIEKPDANHSVVIALGIRIPLSRGVREQRLGRDLNSQFRYIRENMDSANEAQREAFFDAFGDIAIDRNTLGLKRNDLAARVTFTDVALGNTSYVKSFSRIPGSTFVLGHMDEDPFQIQNYGRIRVFVPDFKLSRTTVTNKEYKLFLAAMGLDFPDAAYYASYITEDGQSFDDITGELEFTPDQLPEGVSIDGPEFLFPVEDSWKEQNLQTILRFEDYFYNQRYDNHPVVAVNWYQAMMFAEWAGFRLPSESEWEYSAKSGVGGRVFPWDGYTVQDRQGNFLANYMQEPGVYNLDGYTLMAPVNAFDPNDFGLYNMAGNVSEWVLDAYSNSYQILNREQRYTSSLYFKLDEPRKIHRGGSWASSRFFIGSGVRNFGLGHQASPRIGFRVAVSSGIGEDGESILDMLDREFE